MMLYILYLIFEKLKEEKKKEIKAKIARLIIVKVLL